MPRVWFAEPEEAAVVAGLLVEFRDFIGRSTPAADRFLAGVQRLMDDPATEYLLGAPDGEPATGICVLRYRWGLWSDGEDCCLEDLFVRKSTRGTGLGRALAEAAVKHARERGCTRMELDASSENPAAVGLYETLGFSSADDELGGRHLQMRLGLRR
jgi:GNAT superfamily N-acetyltransferase